MNRWDAPGRAAQGRFAQLGSFEEQGPEPMGNRKQPDLVMTFGLASIDLNRRALRFHSGIRFLMSGFFRAFFSASSPFDSVCFSSWQARSLSMRFFIQSLTALPLV